MTLNGTDIVESFGAGGDALCLNPRVLKSENGERERFRMVRQQQRIPEGAFVVTCTD